MADNLRQDGNEQDGAPREVPPAESVSSRPSPEPERTLVMDADQINRTMVIDDVPDRTIVLSAENGVTRADPQHGDTQSSLLDETRSRIQTILHTPSSFLSALTGMGKLDVGERINGMDHHRERAEVGSGGNRPAHLTDFEDRFEIERKLAEGSRYVVSIGREISLERQVAVYSLRDEKLLDPDERASFIMEAEISAQLDHPSVLPVYSLNRDYRGGLHSTVKLTDGTDFRKYLNRIVSHYRSSGFHAAEEAASLAYRLELVLGISDGLVYAHSRGVVHSNLHPQNILIGEYHEVYIKGWGYAHFLSASGKDATKERKMPEISDPRFVAPEIISGSTPSIQSDVYALGMMLYEIVTLHPPYPDASAPEILELLRDGVSPVIEHRFGGAVDPDMRAIIQKAIAPDPEKRYATINDFSEDIRRFLHSEETSVRRISLSKRFAKLIREHHRGMFFCFMTLICLVGALFAYNIFNDVRLARVSYLNDHVLGKAQASCRKTAHQFNLQAEKFNDMLTSIKFETEFLLSGHMEFRNEGLQHLAPPDDKAVAGSGGIQTEYSPGYSDSVSFRKIEAGRQDDLKDPGFTRLGMLQPTLFRYMLLAPLNAYVSKESTDRQIHGLTQNVNPVYRIQIILADGASLHYPYTLKSESELDDKIAWYDRAISSHNGMPYWNTPAPLDGSAAGSERIVLPVSIPLGPPDAPIGAAALLVSGRYFDHILREAENLPRGLASQYFIAKDGMVRLERINNGPQKAPTVNLEKGAYPDPWLMDWLAGREFGSVIRKETGGSFVYCCSYVPAMEEWYVEKIHLREFLRESAPDRKGGME